MVGPSLPSNPIQMSSSARSGDAFSGPLSAGGHTFNFSPAGGTDIRMSDFMLPLAILAAAFLLRKG